MKRGVILFVVFLLYIFAVTAVDIPEDFSLDDLPPEVREKLPENFTEEDIPDDLTNEDLLDLAEEYNISTTELLALSDVNVSQLCDEFMNQFEFESIEIPSFVPFTYDVFNIYIEDIIPLGHIEIADKKVVSVNCTEHPVATYEIFLKDLDTIVEVAQADYPFEAYRYQKKQGNIKFKGVKFGGMVKVAFLNAAIGVMALFG